MKIESAKKSAGERALEFVEEGMLVGLGTGSTASYFIEALGKKIQEGFSIKAIATSEKSVSLAKQWNIPLLNYQEVSYLDLTVDGADEIDPNLNMIKGGGGALLREKITAVMSKRYVIIVDSTKCVETLGSFPLPLEIIPYGYKNTIKRLNDLGYNGTLRQNEAKTFVTDGGHYIYDLHNIETISNPSSLHFELKGVVGVVETGLFFNLADKAIVGYENGQSKILG